QPRLRGLPRRQCLCGDRRGTTGSQLPITVEGGPPNGGGPPVVAVLGSALGTGPQRCREEGDTMTKRALTAVLLAVVTMAAAACTSTKPKAPDQGGGQRPSGGTPQSAFFNQADFDRQMAQRRIAPQGDPGTPWLQMIQPSMVDTARYAKRGRWHLCFSNAALDNPWRVTGMTTMKAEVKLHPEITDFTVLDAGGKDDKQISDIADLQTRNCSALIISPNTTNALTPAIEKACQTGVP